MPLVPEKTYLRWFEPDSWMYQQFKYCYENPLWNRSIPQGYSLCPYFWQSLIVGFILLRCVVVPTVMIAELLFKGVLKGAFDWPEWKLRQALAFTMSKTWMYGEDMTWQEKLRRRESHGLGLAVGLLLLLIVVGCVTIFGGAIFAFTICFMLVPTVFLTIAIGTVVFKCTRKYINDHRWEEDRCRVEIYETVYLAIAAIVLIGCIIAKIELIWMGLCVFGGWIGSAFSWCCDAVASFFPLDKAGSSRQDRAPSDENHREEDGRTEGSDRRAKAEEIALEILQA